MLDRHLEPEWPNLTTVQENDEYAKSRYKYYYDKHHGVKSLPPLESGTPVLVRTEHDKNWKQQAVISSPAATPRSYILNSDNGNSVRRNRMHIRPVHQSATNSQQQDKTDSSGSSANVSGSSTNVCGSSTTVSGSSSTVTRSGRSVKPVTKLDL